MAFDFFVQNQFVNASMQNAAAGAGASFSIGSLLGQQVSMIASPLSMLANAAEEMTFAVDRTKEFELEERKDRERTDSSMKRRVEMYKELMHQAGKGQKLDMLKDSLRAQAKKEQVLKQALEQFPDYSDAWTALNSILEEFENDSSISLEVKSALTSALKGAMHELEANHGAEIRTGIHGALSAHGFEELGTSDDMRDLYRQTTFDFTSVNQVFQFVQEKYAGVGFGKAMDFLFAAISADIASDQPSMEKTHLEFVHGNLGKVRLLQNAFIHCEKLIERWENEHQVTRHKLASMDLLSAVLSLRETKYLGTMHIEGIVQRAKAPDIEKEVLFIQDFMSMLRNFPEKVFDDIQNYQKIMDVSQQTLDKAIEREDEYLANLE